MPPTRTAKHNSQASSSKLKLNSKRPDGTMHRRKHTNQDANAQTVPGVQKIKSALRQTRRLLAKDKLAADVRVETERRLKALEADLAQAERVRKERTLAQRYHKVKFFERQKVARKLNQTKRELEACTDRKEKKKLEKALLELRVDLNYILHYPKLKKYISLFPPEVRQKGSGDGNSKAQEEAATDIQRQELRQQIREQMERGELSNEPELEDHSARRGAVGSYEGAEYESSKKSGGKGKEEGRSGPKRVPEIAEDEFFGEESDEDDEGGGARENDEGGEMDED